MFDLWKVNRLVFREKPAEQVPSPGLITEPLGPKEIDPADVTRAFEDFGFQNVSFHAELLDGMRVASRGYYEFSYAGQDVKVALRRSDDQHGFSFELPRSDRFEGKVISRQGINQALAAIKDVLDASNPDIVSEMFGKAGLPVEFKDGNSMTDEYEARLDGYTGVNIQISKSVNEGYVHIYGQMYSLKDHPEGLFGVDKREDSDEKSPAQGFAVEGRMSLKEGVARFIEEARLRMDVREN